MTAVWPEAPLNSRIRPFAPIGTTARLATVAETAIAGTPPRPRIGTEMEAPPLTGPNAPTPVLVSRTRAGGRARKAPAAVGAEVADIGCSGAAAASDGTMRARAIS